MKRKPPMVYDMTTQQWPRKTLAFTWKREGDPRGVALRGALRLTRAWR